MNNTFLTISQLEKIIITLVLRFSFISHRTSGFAICINCLVQNEELKAVLCCLPLYRRRNVEVRDGTQFSKVYDSIKEAVKDFGMSRCYITLNGQSSWNCSRTQNWKLAEKVRLDKTYKWLKWLSWLKYQSSDDSSTVQISQSVLLVKWLNGENT